MGGVSVGLRLLDGAGRVLRRRVDREEAKRDRRRVDEVVFRARWYAGKTPGLNGPSLTGDDRRAVPLDEHQRLIYVVHLLADLTWLRSPVARRRRKASFSFALAKMSMFMAWPVMAKNCSPRSDNARD